MNSFNRPLIGMINKYIGPKVAALITGASVLGAQFTEFYTSITASLPFSPNITELVKQFALDNSLVSLLPAPLLALITYYFRRAPHDDEINDLIRKKEDARRFERHFERAILNDRKEQPEIHVDLASGERAELKQASGNGDIIENRVPGMEIEKGADRTFTYEGDTQRDLDKLRQRADQYVDAGLAPEYEEPVHDMPNRHVFDEDHQDYVPGLTPRNSPPMDAAEAKARVAERLHGENRQYPDHDLTDFVNRAEDAYYEPLSDEPVNEALDSYHVPYDSNGIPTSDELYEDHERSQLDVNEIDPNYDRNMAILARKERDEALDENQHLRGVLIEKDERAEKERDELRLKIMHLEDKLQERSEDPLKTTNIAEMQDDIVKQIEGDYILPLEERLASINENFDAYVETIDKKFNLIGENERTEILKDAPGVIKPHDFWPNDTQPELEKYFGKMGENQAMFQLPYTMQLAWDKDTKIQRFSCHEKVAEALNSIFNRTLDHYGVDGIRELGLDQFGGCLNVRLMRGSDGRYSTHSWGISVDLDPDRNGLRVRGDDARLGKDDAIPFWQIVESTGAQSSGRVRGFDFMHWQFCSFNR